MLKISRKEVNSLIIILNKTTTTKLYVQHLTVDERYKAFFWWNKWIQHSSYI